MNDEIMIILCKNEEKCLKGGELRNVSKSKEGSCFFDVKEVIDKTQWDGFNLIVTFWLCICQTNQSLFNAIQSALIRRGSILFYAWTFQQ